MDTLKVTPWIADLPPTESAIRSLLEDEGRTYYRWGNAPWDTYPAHAHPFNKIIYVLSGTITFSLPLNDGAVTLHPGDRLDLPAGTLHSAIVGAAGVECFEAHC